MFIIRVALCMALFFVQNLSFADQAYLERFQRYQQWREALPIQADEAFINFINQDKPLSKKLRQLWLYKLAEEQQWSSFINYYQNSDELALQCHYAWAVYQSGDQKKAVNLAKPLWLVGNSQHSACNPLFSALLASKDIDNTLIEKRITLALRTRNLPLARFLLKQISPARTADIATLIQIYQNPTQITQLSTAPLHDEFYLYGLKRMVSKNMDQAIQYWRHVKSKKLLNIEQQQAFIAHVALYKAMRNQKDARTWFNKVHRDHYNEPLLDWQIRFALKNNQWEEVVQLIKLMPDSKDPSLIYWHARALEKAGKKDEARQKYQTLSHMRHYYGFLASTRLNQSLNFEEENASETSSTLKDYQSVLDDIRQYYQADKIYSASKMINDFSSELDAKEQAALAAWAASELQWYGKSVFLANEESLHNRLDLRFPLAHGSIIQNEVQNKTIPKAFVYAIIRQESAFRAEVISPVGAHGLMQIMPKTAQMVAKNARISYQGTRELFEAEKNIRLGVAYLAQLSQRFNGHPALMAAAYNAGPHQVNRWLREAKPEDVDIWIETIPFHETRNYLKNVMAFYAVYLHRMKQPSKLKYFFQPVQAIH